MTGCEGPSVGAEALAGLVAGGRALGEAVGGDKTTPSAESGLFANLLAAAWAALVAPRPAEANPADAAEVAPAGTEGAADAALEGGPPAGAGFAAGPLAGEATQLQGEVVADGGASRTPEAAAGGGVRAPATPGVVTEEPTGAGSAPPKGAGEGTGAFNTTSAGDTKAVAGAAQRPADGKSPGATPAQPAVDPPVGEADAPRAGGVDSPRAPDQAPAAEAGKDTVWVAGVRAAADEVPAGVGGPVSTDAGRTAAQPLDSSAGKAEGAAERVAPKLSEPERAVPRPVPPTGADQPAAVGPRPPQAEQPTPQQPAPKEAAVAGKRPPLDRAAAAAVEPAGEVGAPAAEVKVAEAKGAPGKGDFGGEAGDQGGKAPRAPIQPVAERGEQAPGPDEGPSGSAARDEAARPFARAEWRDLPQFVRRAEVMAQAGRPTEMRLQLVPEHLGRLSLRVAVAEGGVTARLVVETPEVKLLVEQRLPELERALREQGLRLDSLSVGCEGAGAGNSGFLREEIREEVARGLSYGAARRRYEEDPSGLATEALAPSVSHLWTGNGSLLDALV